MDFQAEVMKAVQEGNKHIDGIMGRINFLEAAHAKANRPHLGGNSVINDPEAKAQTEAFGRYLRTGDKAELKSMSIGSSSDGGFSVPKAIDQMIEAVAFKQSPIRQYATVQQISTSDFHKLVNRRGWGASWVGETAARPATGTAQLVDIAPPMGELYANPQATQQMIDDAFFDVGAWLAEEIGGAFGEAESSAFVTGNGVNQPMGLLSAPTASTSDATRPFGTLQYIPTGAAGDWVASPNAANVLLQTIFSIKVNYRPGSVWMMHPTLLQDIMTMKDSYGRFIFQPAMDEGAPPTLWGYPVVEAEHFPAKAANSLSIAFGNFKRGYLIVDRIGTRVLVDPFSLKPYVGYYCSKRVGGNVVNSEAIRLIKFAAS